MLTVYSKPNCVQCTATKRKLKQLGRNFREINIEEDEMAYNFVKGMGYQQVPVVVVGFAHPTMGGQHWSGYDPDKLTEVALVEQADDDNEAAA